MKTISLRNLPDAVARAIQRRARQRKTSLNRTVIELLEEALDTSGSRPREEYHDLDFFIGSWSSQEASEFDRALQEQRRIDPEAWK